jgi:hypothetical protein
MIPVHTKEGDDIPIHTLRDLANPNYHSCCACLTRFQRLLCAFNLSVCYFIGIGHFTILDSQNVSPEDAGNNFFLHQSSIGKSRAKESVQHLSELNDAVEAVADTSVRNIIFLSLSTQVSMCFG